jgi:para-aminobenzoate synthetase component 1
LWADGGSGPAAGPSGYASTSHKITAYPSRVDHVRVEDLPPGGLNSWLQRRLEAGSGLTALLLSYDAGRNLEALSESAKESPRLPDVVLVHYDAWLEADNESGPWRYVETRRGAGLPLLTAIARGDGARTPLDEITLKSRTTEAEHRAGVEALKEAIARGDLYQANLSRRLEASFDPEQTPELYARLRTTSPPALGALWRLDETLWLASVSPECLLDFDAGTRRAASYPIKGTRPRGEGASDQMLATELQFDEKERAEHLMIVDLVRNDLGRVSDAGSVEVQDLFGLQSLPTVHHLVTEVSATVTAETTLADLILALFPGGSITGAPKIAAQEAIEHLEGLRRGFYTGSFGLVDHRTGAATFNILIRTCVAAGGRLYYQTGGGIVADSDPAREWTETQHKAAALVAATRGA